MAGESLKVLRRPSGFLVSGTHSGAGKTTVTSLLLGALCDRGLTVQPFKLGPDFIDSAYHADICGRASINLDCWMMGRDGVRASFESWAGEADVSVVEAMGGLYDGSDGTGNGSAAEVAKLLGLPVIVVIDAWGMTRTVAAVLEGLVGFDPRLRIAGCVLNRVGSARHAEMIERALPPRLRRLVIGSVPHCGELEIPERHLGLTTVQEMRHSRSARRPAQKLAAEGLDIDFALRLAGLTLDSDREPRPPTAGPERRAGGRARACLAIAEDDAFHFYYEENLRLLREAGFELVGFRPTVDPGLPAGVDAVYIGGGYPESFAAELQSNDSLGAELRTRAVAGMPVYGECGGFVYLGRSLIGLDGVRYRMSGVLPIDFTMDPEHLAIAYVGLSTRVDSPLGPAGTSLRGQEFHQSRIVGGDAGCDLYDVTTSDRRGYREGRLFGSVAGSYAHLHLASNPAVAANLMKAARAYRAKQGKRQSNDGRNHESV